MRAFLSTRGELKEDEHGGWNCKGGGGSSYGCGNEVIVVGGKNYGGVCGSSGGGDSLSPSL